MSFLLPNGPVPVYFVIWQTLDTRFATAASVSLGFAAGGCYFLGATQAWLKQP